MCDQSRAALDGLRAGFAVAVTSAADFERECRSLQKSARVARALVTLAEVNGISIEDAAAIIRDAKARYGLTDKQVCRVIDVIVGAKRAAPISVEDFNDG